MGILSYSDSLPNTCGRSTEEKDKECNHHLSCGYPCSHYKIAAVNSSMLGTTCKVSYVLRFEVKRLTRLELAYPAKLLDSRGAGFHRRQDLI